MDQRNKLGTEGEQMTAKYLQSHGFSIEHKNYRQRYGEIDLIARKDNLLVFVEVKRRAKTYFDLGQLITHSKQRKISMVANQYIAQYGYDQMDCRFDVALIEGNRLTYLENAFEETL